MNLRLTLQSALLLTAAALLGYGLAGYINAAFHVPAGTSTILNSFWALEAIALGISILAGFAYPEIRGVRRGDSLMAAVPTRQSMGGAQYAFVANVPVIALEDGRVGSKIRVQVDASRRGEGIITSYAGTITPGAIKLTEAER